LAGANAVTFSDRLVEQYFIESRREELLALVTIPSDYPDPMQLSFDL
jgi:hypothetical protein